MKYNESFYILMFFFVTTTIVMGPYIQTVAVITFPVYSEP